MCAVYFRAFNLAIFFRDCGNTVCVGLTGMVRMLIQKSTGMVLPFFYCNKYIIEYTKGFFCVSCFRMP